MILILATYHKNVSEFNKYEKLIFYCWLICLECFKMLWIIKQTYYIERVNKEMILNHRTLNNMDHVSI